MNLKPLFLFLTLLLSTGVSSQNKILDSLIEISNYSEFLKRLPVQTKFDKDSSRFYYYQLKYNLTLREYDSAISYYQKIDTSQLDKAYRAWCMYYIADVYRFLNYEQQGASLKLVAQDLFLDIGDIASANLVNNDLHYIFISQDFLDYDGKTYLDSFYESAYKRKDFEQLFSAYLALSMLEVDSARIDVSRNYLNKAKAILPELKSDQYYYRYYNYLSVFHQYFSGDYSKAINMADSSMYFARKLNDGAYMDSAIKNKANSYSISGNYQKAVDELKKGINIDLKKQSLKRKQALFNSLSVNYDRLGAVDSSFKYLKLKNKYDSKIAISTQNATLNLLRTQELVDQNKDLEYKNIRSRDYLITTLIIVILMLLIGITVIMNLKKKKLLLEKEEALKQAKIDHLIKEQEILSIDAQYEGREKERERIASDLHDNLGSLLSTIKLYLQNIEIRKERLRDEEERLMKKTNELVDEAYQKVRNIAHLEGTGTYSNLGLVEAISSFAMRVNASGGLLVEVHSDGPVINLPREDQKILRRIIIELITNSIKHANAEGIWVEFMNAGNRLTILVSDDGIGMDTSLIEKSNGIGIKSAKQKIEKLKGKIKLDSTPNKGTTIIIEIPKA